MKLLPHMAILLVAHFGQEFVFAHNPQYCLGAMMDSLALQPDMYPAIAVSSSTMFLALGNLAGQCFIPVGFVHSLYVVVVAAT